MTVRVAFGRRGNWLGAALGAIAFAALAAAPWWGGRDDLQLLSEIYAYVALRAYGICWPAMPGSFRLANRPMSASAPIACSRLQSCSAFHRCGRSRSPA